MIQAGPERKPLLAAIRAGDVPDMRDVEAELSRLLAEINNVNGQLGERNRTGPYGTRLESPEYWEWRGRALAAKRRLEVDYRTLKAWLKERRVAVAAVTARQALALDENAGPLELLNLLHYQVVRWLKHGQVRGLEEEDQVLLDAVQACVQREAEAKEQRAREEEERLAEQVQALRHATRAAQRDERERGRPELWK